MPKHLPPPSASTRGSSPNPPYRSRTTVACQKCRKDKVKCIPPPENPHGACERCIEKGQSNCRYVSVDQEKAEREVGPRPSPSPVSTSSSSSASPYSTSQTSHFQVTPHQVANPYQHEPNAVPFGASESHRYNQDWPANVNSANPVAYYPPGGQASPPICNPHVDHVHSPVYDHGGQMHSPAYSPQESDMYLRTSTIRHRTNSESTSSGSHFDEFSPTSDYQDNQEYLTSYGSQGVPTYTITSTQYSPESQIPRTQPNGWAGTQPSGVAPTPQDHLMTMGGTGQELTANYSYQTIEQGNDILPNANSGDEWYRNQ